MLDRVIDLLVSLAHENPNLILPLATLAVCALGMHMIYKIAMAALRKGRDDD